MKRSNFLHSTGLAASVASSASILAPGYSEAATLVRGIGRVASPRYVGRSAGPMTPALMRSVLGSYFDALYASWPGLEISPVTGWKLAGKMFSGQYPQYEETYDNYYASYVQQMSNEWNAQFPPAAFIHERSAKPLDRAGDVATCAAWIGGCAGIALAMAIGSPIELGAAAGIAIFGIGTYIYASFNTSLAPSDLATAIIDASVPAGFVGGAADLASSVGKIQSVKGGYSPYAFLAGGVIGAVAYFLRKYYPQIFKPITQGGPGPNYPPNPNTINWIPLTTYSVTVTFDGTPLPQALPV